MKRPEFMEHTFSYKHKLSEEAKRILDMILIWTNDNGECAIELSDAAQFLGNDEIFTLIDYGFIAVEPDHTRKDPCMRIVVPTYAEMWARLFMWQEEMRNTNANKSKGEGEAK